jgi:Domain of unknown function (DUF4430)
VFRRLMILAVLAALFAVLGEAALGVNVKVRVEGKTQTIYGAAEPQVAVPAATALAALEAASARGEFYYHVTQFSFGPFVDQIGRYKAEGSNGWTFKVNGVSPQVGSDVTPVKDGDVVLWYWATFGPTGGPPTLVLRLTKKNCYAVTAQDDTGRAQPASGAALFVDGKRRSTRAGRACIGRHVGLVRATRAGAVRSNALR